MFTLEHPPGGACVIRGDMTVYTVRELRDRLAAAGATELDLSGVTEFDSAGLQLLLALQARVVGWSDEVRDLAALYRVEPRLLQEGRP